MQKKNETKSALSQLQYSVRLTANCKNHAANRIEKFKHISLGIIIFASLGLIFIPLYFLVFPLDPDKDALYKGFIDIAQIFLAIVTLIFSTIISLSSHEIRINKLRECGSRLRNLTKELKIFEEEIEEIINKKDTDEKKDTNEELKKFLKKYYIIINNSEPHSELDFIYASFEKQSFLKKVLGLYWWKRYINIHCFYLILLLTVPIIEVFIILDILNIINIFKCYFHIW